MNFLRYLPAWGLLALIVTCSMLVEARKSDGESRLQLSSSKPSLARKEAPRARFFKTALKQDVPSTLAAPEWYREGSRKVDKNHLIGVSLEGQTSVQSATTNLLQLLREEILRELQYSNVTDSKVLPELSLDFIEFNLIPRGHLELHPYEDHLTREAAELEGRTPTPYYRGFAQAILTPEFFNLERRWKRYPQIRQSLKWIGLGAGGVLASLALLFGYLKTDHLTHSHYTRRLQTLFASLLVAIAFLLYWLL
jgi:hypothetical protein